MTSLRGKLILAGVVVAGALAIRVPVPALSEQLSRRAQSSWQLTLQSEGARFGLLGGTRLTGLAVDAASEDFHLTVRSPRVLVRHGWRPWRPLVIESLQLLDPNVEITLGPGAPTPGRGRDPAARDEPEDTGAAPSEPSIATSASRRFDVEDISIALDRATLTLQDTGADGLSLQATGLGARLHSFRKAAPGRSWLESVSADGGFLADALQLGPIRLLDSSGRLLIGDGRIRVSDFRFACGRAELQLDELEIDLTTQPISFTTRDPVLERPRGGDDDQWTPLASLTELGPRCL